MERWASILREVLDTKPMTREEQDDRGISHVQRHERDICEYLGHQVPESLAKMMATQTVKSRRKIIKHIYGHRPIQPFSRFEEYPHSVPGFLHPADKYQEPDSPAQLSKMAESEQPSAVGNGIVTGTRFAPLE